MLPQVKAEIFLPIIAEANRSLRGDSSWLNKLIDQLEKEQPNIYQVVKGMAASAYENCGLAAMNMVILGALVVYKGIVNQLEVNELED